MGARQQERHHRIVGVESCGSLQRFEGGFEKAKLKTLLVPGQGGPRFLEKVVEVGGLLRPTDCEGDGAYRWGRCRWRREGGHANSNDGEVQYQLMGD